MAFLVFLGVCGLIAICIIIWALIERRKILSERRGQ